MTIAIHRQDDSRICGATTVVTGQTTVYANGKLVAVNGDKNTHGEGGLIAATKQVYIAGKMVVNLGDSAAQDNLCGVIGQPATHCDPYTTTGSSNVFVGNP
jgi:uncharacterized Zn-binding protein involved in type VI secretion